ncbi:hypothetical protein T03_9488 [Trichinella britovi]|uniref:DDE-1 domain-containing protein n=1 Tax=Trichinella britovi TaxID=45882 RepID=A0A0V1DBG2_TRIBR|nr:hypothetical protein T03_9488 [Trichinella britovi]
MVYKLRSVIRLIVILNQLPGKYAVVFPSCQRWKQVPFASAYFYDNWLASLVKFLKSKYSNDGRRYDRIICISTMDGIDSSLNCLTGLTL